MTKTIAADHGDKPAIGPVLATLLLAGLAVFVARGAWGYSHDDAFITYRYAENLARGHGLVYNPGEAVLGTSAPGYAAVLGGLSLLTREAGWRAPQWGTPRLRVALPLLGGALMLPLRWNVELFGSETLPVLGLVVAANLVILGPSPDRGGPSTRPHRPATSCPRPSRLHRRHSRPLRRSPR